VIHHFVESLGIEHAKTLGVETINLRQNDPFCRMFVGFGRKSYPQPNAGRVTWESLM
jgi:hypothetical protein